jgi:molecular chaperone GrpE
MVKKEKSEEKEGTQEREGLAPETGTGGDPVGPREAEGDLVARLQEAEAKAAEHYDKYVRVLADLENYKKRAIREKAEAIQYGNESLLRDILPIVDSMDRALVQSCDSEDFAAFREGLQRLREQMLGCLQRHGVEPIETEGKAFDPHVHEAMMQVASDTHQESDVVGEFERGYLLKGRLLRPAKVSVCKGGNRTDCE